MFHCLLPYPKGARSVVFLPPIPGGEMLLLKPSTQASFHYPPQQAFLFQGAGFFSTALSSHFKKHTYRQPTVWPPLWNP